MTMQSKLIRNRWQSLEGLLDSFNKPLAIKFSRRLEGIYKHMFMTKKDKYLVKVFKRYIKLDKNWHIIRRWIKISEYKFSDKKSAYKFMNMLMRDKYLVIKIQRLGVFK